MFFLKYPKLTIGHYEIRSMNLLENQNRKSEWMNSKTNPTIYSKIKSKT